MQNIYFNPKLQSNLENISFIPNITEEYEFKLAHLEYQSLENQDKLDRLGYFKSYEGEETLHFKLCNHTNTLPITLNTKKLKYFSKNKYSVGYATHGIYPYKGKFHGQLVKSIINILKLKSNQVILDPFAGSGTTNIEASLLGIDSIGFDINPFSNFLNNLKFNLLHVDVNFFENYEKLGENLYPILSLPTNKYVSSKINDQLKIKHNLFLLAYFFVKNYEKRNHISPSISNYLKILKQLKIKILSFMEFRKEYLKNLGRMKILNESSAINFQIKNKSIDSIITSPPYTDMINYPYNDELQNKILGYDPSIIKEKTIGLKGKLRHEKIGNYISDLNLFFSECSRVLKDNSYLVMVIGYKDSDIKKYDLKNKIRYLAQNNGFTLKYKMNKTIPGYQNKLLNEEILFFEI